MIELITYPGLKAGANQSDSNKIMIEQLSIRWRPRQRQIKEKYDKLIGEGLPFRNVGGYPDDVEKAISALAPRDFPYSTGQVIVIDGGITLSRF